MLNAGKSSAKVILYALSVLVLPATVIASSLIIGTSLKLKERQK